MDVICVESCYDSDPMQEKKASEWDFRFVDLGQAVHFRGWLPACKAQLIIYCTSDLPKCS